MTSVNTNFGALVALQNLNATSKQLEEVQSRINTGFKVVSAKDNGAVFAIAEGLRTRVGALSGVSDGIDRANTAIDVALAAGTQIGDVLKQLRDKATAAQGAGLSTEQKSVLQSDFDASRGIIDNIANSATFNGANLANGTNTGGNALSVLTTDTGAAGGSGGFYVTGGPGDTATTGALTSNTTLIGTAGIGVVGLDTAADDSVQIVLFGADGVVGGTDNRTINIAFEAGDTIADYITRVNTQTNGQLTASFDAAHGRISYTSQQGFSVDFIDGTAGAAANLEQIFAGGTASAANTAARYSGGGGYQTSTAALASGTTAGTLISQLDTTDNNNEALTFTFGSGTEQRVFSVSFDGVATLGDLLSKVSTVTNGLVSANYDATSRTINYRSDQAFNIAEVGTFSTANTFTPAVAAANLVPTANGGGASGSGQLAVTGFDFRLGKGALSTVTNSLDISTDAAGAASAINTAITALNTSLAKLGSQSKALDVQKDFLTVLSDNVTKGIGALVDADLAKESARLQALQVKQQLGAQALSIANQGPSILLSFFR